MSIKSKILSVITAHPKLVTLGIGFAVTFVIGTSVGLVNHDAFALTQTSGQSSGQG